MSVSRSSASKSLPPRCRRPRAHHHGHGRVSSRPRGGKAAGFGERLISCHLVASSASINEFYIWWASFPVEASGMSVALPRLQHCNTKSRMGWARATSGHDAAAPPRSVMKSRRLMPDMGFLPPAWFAARLSLPQSGRRVLWTKVNRSESRWQVPVRLGAQCLTQQRPTASGARPSLECFRRTDTSAPPAESPPGTKIFFLQKRLSHKGCPLMG